LGELSSVSDPDPAFYVLNTDPDSIGIQGSDDPKLKKTAKKIYNLPIPRPPERTSKIQKKPF
jgi:hypothetical protein